jgi:hypothetical protein
MELERRLRDVITPYTNAVVDRDCERFKPYFPEGTDPIYQHEVVGSDGWGDRWYIEKTRTMSLGIPDTADHSKRSPRIVPGAESVRRYKRDEWPQLNMLGGPLRMYGKRPKDVRFLSHMLEQTQKIDAGLAREYESDYYFNADIPFGLFEAEQAVLTRTDRRTPVVCAAVARAALTSMNKPPKTLEALPYEIGGILLAAMKNKFLSDPYSPFRQNLRAVLHGSRPLPEAHLTLSTSTQKTA